MTLTAKQLIRVKSLQSMIDGNLRRMARQERCDKTVFHKAEKWVTIWVQNASDRAALDSCSELQTLLHNLTSIVTGVWDMEGFLAPLTTKYKLEQCQLVIVKGLMDRKDPWGQIPRALKSGGLLPVVQSYCTLVL